MIDLGECSTDLCCFERSLLATDCVHFILVDFDSGHFLEVRFIVCRWDVDFCLFFLVGAFSTVLFSMFSGLLFDLLQ